MIYYADEYGKWRRAADTVARDAVKWMLVMERFAKVCEKKQILWKRKPPLPPSITNGMTTVNNPAAIYKSLRSGLVSSELATIDTLTRRMWMSRLLSFMDITKGLNATRLPLSGCPAEDCPENYNNARLARDARKFLDSLGGDRYRHRHELNDVVR